MKRVIDNLHADALQTFRDYKKMAERAIEQVSDEHFFALIDAESNSIALIVKHVAGNLRSRWTDFLTSDGEKSFRDRDTEFENTGDTRESLMQLWESGWQTLFEAVESLTTDDFLRTVTIRGEPHSICEAVNRQLTHYSFHIGQIVLLAKHFRSTDWQTLSVPKSSSATFNAFLAEQRTPGAPKINRLDAPIVFAGVEKEKGEL